MRRSETAWHWWAKRHGCEYLQITDSLYPAPWAKFSVFQQLETRGIAFERVLVVDYDTLVRARCPNFLGNVGDGFFAVPDLGDLDWIARAIRKARPTLGPPTFGVCDYFNTGMLVMDKSHLPLAEDVLQAGLSGAGNYVDGDYEQTFVNYAVRRLGPLKLLPLTYNLTKLTLRGLFQAEQAWAEAGDVLHFNEPDRERKLEWVWNSICAEYQ